MSSDPLATVADWIRSASHVTALTGAGVSTASGIPDYRGPQGLWTRDPKAERLSDIRYYVSDPEIRAEAWRRRAAGAATGAEPNRAHHALVELEQQGNLHAVVTQNVDGLHADAADAADVRVELVELHGNASAVVCRDCGRREDADSAFERARRGELPPRCPGCGGVLKPDVVLFGEPLDPADLDRARELARRADVFLAVGSSLTVEPAASLPGVASRNGATLAVVNFDETPYSPDADVDLRADVTDVLPHLREVIAASTDEPPARD